MNSSGFFLKKKPPLRIFERIILTLILL